MERESAIHVVADLRAREMEEEIVTLRKRLDQFQQRVAAETARRVEIESRARTEEAFQKGLDQGYKQGRASIAEDVALLHKLAVEIEQGLDTIWKECREQMVELTLLIARKVVGTIADQYPELARELTAHCITFARDQIRIKVLVNPEDAEILRRAGAELMSLAEGVKEIEIAERVSISRGGVILETESGQIDARLEEQLDVVASVLKPGWSQPGNKHQNQNNRSESNADQTS
jgi:flagellar assembly protein FliH